MIYYRFGESVLESSVELPGLTQIAAAPPIIALDTVRAPALRRLDVYHQWLTPDGRVMASFARTPIGYAVTFPGIAEFGIEPIFSAWRVCCESGAPAAVQHLFLDIIVPMLLGRNGRIAVHASAVAANGDAIGFMGASGIGKTTLAIEFCTSGHALITDDALLLTPSDEATHAEPGSASLRAWPDVASRIGVATTSLMAEYSDKIRVDVGGEPSWTMAGHPQRLRILYAVEQDDDVNSRPRIVSDSGRSAFERVLPHVYRLDPFDRGETARELHALSRVLGTVKVRRLVVPHRLSAVADVRRLVHDDCVADRALRLA